MPNTIDLYENSLGVSFKKSSSLINYDAVYASWFSYLLNTTVTIFVYENLPFDSHELEVLLQSNGFCGITTLDNTKIPYAVYGSMSGVTNFPDMFTTFTFATPKTSGIRKIKSFIQPNGNLILAENNNLRMANIDIIKIFAHLIAHSDLSIQACLINDRANTLLSADCQSTSDGINEWYNNLAKGYCKSILTDKNYKSLINDKSINAIQMAVSTKSDITELYKLKDCLLSQFYSLFGIVSARDKAERVITAEIDSGAYKALFNISDMLEKRKEMCKSVNEMYGTNWIVKLNKYVNEQISENKEGKKNGVDSRTSAGLLSE